MVVIGSLRLPQEEMSLITGKRNNCSNLISFRQGEIAWATIDNIASSLSCSGILGSVVPMCYNEDYSYFYTQK